MMATRRQQQQYGDFQTPPQLAEDVCTLLQRRGVNPCSIIEPTCGLGAFVAASAHAFGQARHVEGLDLNELHITHAAKTIQPIDGRPRPRFRNADFFKIDWTTYLSEVPQPILIIGNPPWVTNSRLGTLRGDNLPEKSNFQKHRGFDAITGKSNFDISEWMLIRLFEALRGKTATLAMLCKTAVARKALLHGWRTQIPFAAAAIFGFDAKAHFGVSVDACLLVVDLAPHQAATLECPVFPTFKSATPAFVFGFRDGMLVADIAAYQASSSLCSTTTWGWRSGVKHDCASVMEMVSENGQHRNGLGEPVQIEPEHLYPMLKSSAVARGAIVDTSRLLLIPQRAVQEDTASLAITAPHTWAYLLAHADKLDARASSIYRNRPRFSIFGVGEYTFAPWKVVTSALYKKIAFRAVGPIQGRPVVFDDTCNFLPCKTQCEAERIARLLNSERAAQFFHAFVFWDAKRPITIDIMRHLDLRRLAVEMGDHSLYEDMECRENAVAMQPSLAFS